MPLIAKDCGDKEFNERIAVLNTIINWDFQINGKLPIKNILSAVQTNRFGGIKDRTHGIFSEYDAYSVVKILLIINDYIGPKSNITVQDLNQKIIVYIKDYKLSRNLLKLPKDSIIYEVTKISEEALKISFDI